MKQILAFKFKLWLNQKTVDRFVHVVITDNISVWRKRYQQKSSLLQ